MALPGPIITMSAQGPLLGLVYAVVRSASCGAVLAGW